MLLSGKDTIHTHTHTYQPMTSTFSNFFFKNRIMKCTETTGPVFGVDELDGIKKDAIGLDKSILMDAEYVISPSIHPFGESAFVVPEKCRGCDTFQLAKTKKGVRGMCMRVDSVVLQLLTEAVEATYDCGHTV